MLAVLASGSTVLGFKLAGVKLCVKAADNILELTRQFRELVSKDIELLIIDNACEPIREEILRFVEFNKKPVIVEVPCKSKLMEKPLFETIVSYATGAK